MTNKPTKPIHQAKVFTPEQIQEQKRNQALQMLIQKRETFAVNILCHMVDGSDLMNPDTANRIVDVAVSMADHLLEKLYPIKEDKK